MFIRHITSDDIEPLASCHYDAFMSLFKNDLNKEKRSLIKRKDFYDRWAARIENIQGSMFVAEEAGHVKGFVFFDARHESGALPEESEIYMLYDFDEPTGGKIAAALMETALGHLAFAGFNRAYTWLPKENTAYRKFFEQYGFSADGRERIEKQEGLVFTSLHYGKRLHDMDEIVA